MLLVFVMAGVLWGLGVVLKTPLKARFLMIGVLYLAVLALHIVLPAGHPLREQTGGDAKGWLVLAGVIALILAYRFGLGELRRRARAEHADPSTTTPTGTFAEAELNRYARHIVLREVGGPGQKALKHAKVLVIGAGGLGSPALQYLAAAGVGTIGVVDDDVVDNANLHRQVIHKDARIDTPKVFSAQIEMQEQNPFITVHPYKRRLDADSATKLFTDYDIILDGTDNFETRYLVNAAAVAARKPLISGALTQWEGQLSVFDPARDTPCYRCVFPQAPDPSLAPSCAQAGVIGPLPGVIGTMMALEAVKLITQAGAPLRGDMLIYDGLYGETRKIAIKRRADCPDCGQQTARP